MSIIHVGASGDATPTTYGYLTRDFPRLDRFQNALSAACAWLAGAAVLVLCGVTLLEVIMREGFASPLGWNVSLTEKYLLPILAFFGLTTAYRTGSHIAVASLFSRFSPPAKKLVLIITHLLVLATLVAMALGGFTEMMLAVELGHRVWPGQADLPTDDWTWKIVVPVAAALCAVLVAIDVARELLTGWRPTPAPATDYDPGAE